MELLIALWMYVFLFCSIAGFLLLGSSGSKDASFGAKIILTGIFFPIALFIWLAYGFAWLWKTAFWEPGQQNFWGKK